MELADYFRFIFALVFVVALIGALAFLGKRYGLGYRNIPKSTRRRLTISEIMPVDAKRRLVLVRRDDQEHLLLVGGDCDVVVERNITDFETGFDETLRQLEQNDPEKESPQSTDRLEEHST